MTAARCSLALGKALQSMPRTCRASLRSSRFASMACNSGTVHAPIGSSVMPNPSTAHAASYPALSITHPALTSSGIHVRPSIPKLLPKPLRVLRQAVGGRGDIGKRDLACKGSGTGQVGQGGRERQHGGGEWGCRGEVWCMSAPESPGPAVASPSSEHHPPSKRPVCLCAHRPCSSRSWPPGQEAAAERGGDPTPGGSPAASKVRSRSRTSPR